MPTEFGLGDTYFTIYDGMGNVIFEGKADEFMINHTVKPKPPLGVTPKNIFEFMRVQDLCRALYERSIFEEVDYDLMTKWSEELQYRLGILKYERSCKQ